MSRFTQTIVIIFANAEKDFVKMYHNYVFDSLKYF